MSFHCKEVKWHCFCLWFRLTSLSRPSLTPTTTPRTWHQPFWGCPPEYRGHSRVSPVPGLLQHQHPLWNQICHHWVGQDWPDLWVSKCFVGFTYRIRDFICAASLISVSSLFSASPRYLQQTALPPLSPAQCKQYLGYDRITDAMICAGSSVVSSCQVTIISQPEIHICRKNKSFIQKNCNELHL